MSGGHIAKFKQLFKLRIILALILNGVTIVAVSMALSQFTDLPNLLQLGLLGLFAVFLAFLQGQLLSSELSKPTEYLAQAIFHISPNEHLVEAPQIDKLGFGRELVATLTRQIYDFAATSNALNPTPQSDTGKRLLDGLPIIVIGLDKDNNIALVNTAAQERFGLNNCIGMALKTQLQMKFTDKTLEEWFIQVKSKQINAAASWTKVEVSGANNDYRTFCDIAASYQQKSASGIEKLVVLFDHQEVFEDEQDALSLIALTVHEIRTPLTILRGYIEVLKEALEGKIDEQSKEYIDRLSTSAENLTSFMASVLSVVKADQSELTLELQEVSWQEFLSGCIDPLQLRAKVRGKEIHLTIAKDLPTVALDSISINEVLTNLIDNAIKYSPDDKKDIWIDSRLNTDGSIVTTVRDEGVGIPENVVPHLFTRFYRNRRNRTKIAGTGLGLFISKEIISAHHGNIWVDSKEGEGTTVTFTLLPYSRLADVQETSNNTFSKVGHGWIKNHNMQRR